MHQRIEEVKSQWRYEANEETENWNSGDTKIYPLVQMGICDIDQEDHVIRRMFSSNSEGSTVHLASGYFNLTTEYSDLVLKRGKFKLNVLSASPQVRNFTH